MLAGTTEIPSSGAVTRTIQHVAQLAAGQKEVPALAPDRQAVSSNELPGFPPDARVLIVNADDCGMHAASTPRSSNQSITGIASPRALMVPCPGMRAAGPGH